MLNGPHGPHASHDITRQQTHTRRLCDNSRSDETSHELSARAPHSPRLEAARAEAEAAAAAAGGGGNQRPARKAKGRPVSPLRLAAGR